MPDQMRGDCLSVLGHSAVRTPTFDQLAREGVRPEGFSDGVRLISGRPYPPLNDGVPRHPTK